MHSSFAKTLVDVKGNDGSLLRALNQSQTFSGNTASLLLSSSFHHKSPRKPSIACDGLENKVRKHTPSRSFHRSIAAESDADRFIPNRQATDIDRAQFIFSNPSINVQTPSDAQNSSHPSSIDGNSNRSTEDRILEYRLHRPTVPVREPTALRGNTSPQKSARYIPTKPDKVLDAPQIINDYYLNILDWSAQSDIAVALDREVYLWNAHTGSIRLLMSASLEEEHVTSVRWSPVDPKIIAVGTNRGRVQLWDANECALIRTMMFDGPNPMARVPALAWRDHLVSSAARTGEIRQHDIRVPNHEVGLCTTHTQEVCGLEWSPDSRYLASGSNDNLVCVFSAGEVVKRSGVRPEHMFNDHVAAVKAIAWCPWKPNLLCTGGGTADHYLRFWNVATGSSIRAVNAESQVSGLIWNQEYRELITGHGDGKLSLWKYPNINKIKDLCEHQDRVLAITASPDNEMVASCSADETIRIWHCFKVDQAKKRQEESEKKSTFTFSRLIR